MSTSADQYSGVCTVRQRRDRESAKISPIITFMRSFNPSHTRGSNMHLFVLLLASVQETLLLLQQLLSIRVHFGAQIAHRYYIMWDVGSISEAISFKNS